MKTPKKFLLLLASLTMILALVPTQPAPALNQGTLSWSKTTSNPNKHYQREVVVYDQTGHLGWWNAIVSAAEYYNSSMSYGRRQEPKLSLVNASRSYNCVPSKYSICIGPGDMWDWNHPFEVWFRGSSDYDYLTNQANKCHIWINPNKGFNSGTMDRLIRQALGFCVGLHLHDPHPASSVMDSGFPVFPYEYWDWKHVSDKHN